MSNDLLPDALWERVAPLLPARPPRRQRYPGRLPADDRAALRGIVYVLRKGVSWADAPTERIDSSGVTAWRRLRDSTEAGMWPRLHEILLAELRGADHALPLRLPDCVAYYPPTVPPRSWASEPVAGLMRATAAVTAGCSGFSDPAPGSHTGSTSGPGSPSPSPLGPGFLAHLAFCLDLPTFKVGLIAYRGDVIRSQQPDPNELKRKATSIIFMGEKMRASAPQDIARQFRTVPGAVGSSSSKLKPQSQLRDVVDPVFNEKINPVFDAVDKYDCGVEDKCERTLHRATTEAVEPRDDARVGPPTGSLRGPARFRRLQMGSGEIPAGVCIVRTPVPRHQQRSDPCSFGHLLERPGEVGDEDEATLLPVSLDKRPKLRDQGLALNPLVIQSTVRSVGRLGAGLLRCRSPTQSELPDQPAGPGLKDAIDEPSRFHPRDAAEGRATEVLTGTHRPTLKGFVLVLANHELDREKPAPLSGQLRAVVLLHPQEFDGVEAAPSVGRSIRAVRAHYFGVEHPRVVNFPAASLCRGTGDRRSRRTYVARDPRGGAGSHRRRGRRG